MMIFLWASCPHTVNSSSSLFFADASLNTWLTKKIMIRLLWPLWNFFSFIDKNESVLYMYQYRLLKCCLQILGVIFFGLLVFTRVVVLSFCLVIAFLIWMRVFYIHHLNELAHIVWSTWYMHEMLNQSVLCVRNHILSHSIVILSRKLYNL